MARRAVKPAVRSRPAAGREHRPAPVAAGGAGATPRRRAAALLAVSLAASGCIHLAPPAPSPGEAADVTVLETLVRRFRTHPPHRGYPLAVAPVTISFDPERHPVGLRPEFAAAADDLTATGGRLDPIRPPLLAGVPVRREGVYDPYDMQLYLLLRFSPVGFSADSTRAAVVVVFDCGPGCGSQAALGLRRAANRGWRIAELRPGPLPPAPDSTADGEP